jgi:hypothetical protein
MSTVKFCRGILIQGMVLRCLKCNCFHHCLSNVLSAHRQGLCVVSKCVNGANLISYNLNCIGRFKCFRNLRRYSIFLTTLGSRVNILHRKIFPFKFTLRCQQSAIVLFQLFATGVIDTGGEFNANVVDTGGDLPPVSLTSVANLPPVSMTAAVLVAKFATGVVDTGGKFGTSVIDIVFL